MKTIKKILQSVIDEVSSLEAEFLDDYGFDEIDIKNILAQKLDEYDYADRLMEHLNAATEVIYYSHAMEYLRENDPSLVYSLALAHDMGYSLDGLNSEILASLHAREYHEFNQIDFDDLAERICQIVLNNK